ncbi:YihY/virulence factor BrkB family protein [Oscillatoria salina]|uniref:YihY/virulence factor BrkB family protein n=1 Tax=Oscillatoria salina TaxID=331517 RepID=UPI0013BC5445|nr:YihY/virulence factor BrkB family protein [Oscillatoria salina]MBZ8180538.1 YihY/virulence factor BrkB family protein [Oscillatoria salina IIICB1]NET90764.1 YihY/virulence factor BrkB family protein [Kamptonema sp. SIO1D9]
MSPKNIFGLLKEAFSEWQKDKASRLAAALAYYTVFSLAPVVIIAVAIAGSIFGAEAARGEIVGQIQGLVGEAGAEVIETAIENANQPDLKNVASFFSIILLLFGASGVFAELQDSLNTVWNVKAKPGRGITNFVRKRILSFAMVLGIGFLLLVSLVISAAISALSNYPQSLLTGFEFMGQFINIIVSFGVITLLFALIYKYLPDVKIKWSDVRIGAIITALLFTLGKYIIGLYLGRGSFASTYGAAGSVIIILAWVYYSAQILFFGAEFTQVYARKYGSQIMPDRHSVSVTRPKSARQGIERN